MTAEEMFNQLGWYKDERRLSYWKHKEYMGGDEKSYCIAFLESFRQVLFYCTDDDGKTFFDYMVGITVNELIAINKQVIELGWATEGEEE